MFKQLPGKKNKKSCIIPGKINKNKEEKNYHVGPWKKLPQQLIPMFWEMDQFSPVLGLIDVMISFESSKE